MSAVTYLIPPLLSWEENWDEEDVDISRLKSTFRDDMKHRLDRRPDVDEADLSFIVCVSSWSLLLLTWVQSDSSACPSPALHLLTGLSLLPVFSSSSATSLFLVFFCSFPSPVSLHLHSSPSRGLFVLFAGSLSVRLFSSHPLVPPVILRLSPALMCSCLFSVSV